MERVVSDLAIHLRALPLAQGKRFFGRNRMGLESHLSRYLSDRRAY